MNFFQIETFLIIVETKSLSRAAELLYLTQPSVSHRLKSLEDELGIVLLERGKGQRSVELTEKGREFVPIAGRWMELWQNIQLLATSGAAKLPLTLDCMDTLNTYILSPLYRKIARPDGDALFDLHIKTQDTAELHRMAESREIDVGLVYETLPDKNVLIEPVFEERLRIIRLCADPDEVRTAWHPSELDPANELYYNSAPSYKDWHDSWWPPAKKPYVQVDNERLILDFLDHPDLWAVVPASVARAFEKQRPALKTYEILYPPANRVCYRLTHRAPREGHLRSIQLFGDYLKKYVKSLDFLST